MEDVPNLINIGPTNPIQILNQHEICLTILHVSYWGSAANTGSLLVIKQT